MLRRLRIYFTGFAIGLIMVYIMFGNDDSRDLDIWTPSQRILEEIRNDSILNESQTLRCYQMCLGLSDSLLLSIWTDAEVKSLNPGGNPYRYTIFLEKDEHSFSAIIERNEAEEQTLISIEDNKNPTACDCD
jgi:hypothetical protein